MHSLRRRATTVLLCTAIGLVSGGCLQQKAAQQGIAGIDATVGVQADAAIRGMAIGDFNTLAAQADPSAAAQLSPSVIQAKWSAATAPLGAYVGTSPGTSTRANGIVTYTIPIRFTGGVRTATFVYNVSHSLISFDIA
ncbi:MAG TPA: hypothetical protein VM030_06080 [Acidimicrobiales bacterium]|nr:hypothetical protein [Acidimicrobiales bacterium]